jgi:hypothetical protein
MVVGIAVIGLCASMLLYLLAQLWFLGVKEVKDKEDATTVGLEAAVTSLIRRNTELRLEVDTLKMAAARLIISQRKTRLRDKGGDGGGMHRSRSSLW